MIALVLARHGNYRIGFAVLMASAALSLITLVFTQRSYPNPEKFERRSPVQARHLPRAYWLYLAGGAMIGFGFVDFSLIAFHFQKTATLSSNWIPISYAIAMGCGAVGNLFLGRLHDKAGLAILIGVFLIGAAFTPLVFFGNALWATVGMALWGINKGAQDTLFKPAISGLIATDRRSTAFGIFDTGFGVAWLIGSITFGLLYDKSLPALIIVSVVGQLVALPIFFLAKRARQH